MLDHRGPTFRTFLVLIWASNYNGKLDIAWRMLHEDVQRRRSSSQLKGRITLYNSNNVSHRFTYCILDTWPRDPTKFTPRWLICQGYAMARTLCNFGFNGRVQACTWQARPNKTVDFTCFSWHLQKSDFAVHVKFTGDDPKLNWNTWKYRLLLALSLLHWPVKYVEVEWGKLMFKVKTVRTFIKHKCMDHIAVGEHSHHLINLRGRHK